jgi:methyltransferase family protein
MGTNSSTRPDGSVGDADYGTIGSGYTRYRQPEPEFAARIQRALGRAATVLNVGAGAGSYEPDDRTVTAVEPSEAMRAQRPARLPEAINARAESLPFDDGRFDAALASFTVHQWRDLDAGLAEMRRVTTGPILILTCDPGLLDGFWLADYAPEVIQVEARRYPAIERLSTALDEGDGGRRCAVERVPIPLHCVDGFNEAYYGRPERLLDPAARRANSAWSFLDDAVVERFHQRLSQDLADGTWDARHGRLRTQAHFLGSLVLLVTA